MIVVYKHETGTAAVPRMSFCFPALPPHTGSGYRDRFGSVFAQTTLQQHLLGCGVPRKQRVFEAAAWRRDAGVGARPQRVAQHIVLPAVAGFLALVFLTSSCFLHLRVTVSATVGEERVSFPAPSFLWCVSLFKKRKEHQESVLFVCMDLCLCASV